MQGGHGNRGAGFEKLIDRTLEVYALREAAWIARMPVPTAPAGRDRRGVPLRRLCGPAPYDLYGFANDGVAIGCELKESNQRPSLPIVAPGHKGDGLQYHQLDALANLALHHGIARIVWSNGGQVGVLGGAELVLAWRTYNTAMTGKARRGDKSIQWEQFREAKSSLPGGLPDWLFA